MSTTCAARLQITSRTTRIKFAQRQHARRHRTDVLSGPEGERQGTSQTVQTLSRSPSDDGNTLSTSSSSGGGSGGSGSSNAVPPPPPQQQQQLDRRPQLAVAAAALASIGVACYTVLSSQPQLPPVQEVLGPAAAALLGGPALGLLAAKALLGDFFHVELHR